MSESPSPIPPPGRVYEVLTPGETLGEYTVAACMSYDILGSLYRVTDASGTEKTLFVLPKLLTDDESFLRRFKGLSEKLRGMNHPAVLSLTETIQVDGRICFIAEPFRGKSIPDHLGAAGIYPTYGNPQGVVRAHPSEESKDFTPEKALGVTRTMLEALGHAHAKQTLHLNLTPSNVLLSESGEVKVVGFGLYSIIGQSAIEALVSAGIPAVSLGPRNVRLNTADIIAPEVHLRQNPDARADIYALGTSAYWMLTGLKPSSNYRPPSGIVPGLDPGWDIFLARCLSREKSKRYASAEAALTDLNNLSQLITGGTAKAEAKAREAARRRKRLFLLAGIGVATLAGASAAVITLLGENQTVDADFVPPNSPYARASETYAYLLQVPHRDARVITSPGNASFGVHNGELRLLAPAGKVKFAVTAPSFTPRIIEARGDGKTPVTIRVRLARNPGSLAITTEPDAAVFLNDGTSARELLGYADGKGNLKVAGIEAGVYAIEVEKPKCNPARLPGVEIRKGETRSQKIALEGQPATILVKATPEDANISVNGVDQGSAPLTLDKLKPGSTFTIVFTKENYRPVTRTVSVGPGEKIIVSSGEMIPCMGFVRYVPLFSGKAPDAERLAKLTVARSDDKLKPRDWKTAVELPSKLPVGHYLVKASHPDYEPFQTGFTILDDATTKVELAMRALPAPMEFTVSPESVRFTARVNGREYENTFPKSIPAETPVDIEVEARDYEIWKNVVVAKPGRAERIAVSLRRIPSPAFGKGFTLPYLAINLRWIPAGETRLGSPENEPGHRHAEGPFTWAAFTQGYWMGATEITQDQFERVLGVNPSRVKNPGLPVESVSWNDAMRFCKTINEREFKAGRLPLGFEYRLPNELEWEYACRAGTTSPFSFGDKAGPRDGNFRGEYPGDPALPAPAASLPRRVASYPPNAYGLHDMHGNVREWVLDPYAEHLPGGRRSDYNLTVRDLDGDERFARGGSFRMTADECRSATRPAAALRPDHTDEDLGFRIVLAPSPRP